MYADYERIRDKKGLNDSQVAKMAEVARASISEWKSGKKATLTAESLGKIAKVLDCTIEELMGEPSVEERYSSSVVEFLKAYLTLDETNKEDLDRILRSIAKCIKMDIPVSNISMDVKINMNGDFAD